MERCSICHMFEEVQLSPEDERESPLSGKFVACGNCGVTAHRCCFPGADDAPEKGWRCPPCEDGLTPGALSCELCPVRGGKEAFVRDEGGGGLWAHVTCAFRLLQT